MFPEEGHLVIEPPTGKEGCMSASEQALLQAGSPESRESTEISDLSVGCCWGQVAGVRTSLRGNMPVSSGVWAGGLAPSGASGRACGSYSSCCPPQEAGFVRTEGSSGGPWMQG